MVIQKQDQKYHKNSTAYLSLMDYQLLSMNEKIQYRVDSDDE